MRMTVDASDIGRLRGVFARLRKRGLRDLRRVELPGGRRVSFWSDVADDVRSRKREMFETQGQSEGRGWRNYVVTERQYAAIKGSIFGRYVSIAHGDVNRWLAKPERMFPAFTRKHDPNHLEDPQPRKLRIGTRLDYPDDIDKGRGKAPKHLGGGARPARPLFRIGPGLERDLERRAEQLTEAMETDLVRFVRRRFGGS